MANHTRELSGEFSSIGTISDSKKKAPPVPLYEIHLVHYDTPPNGIKWDVVVIDNTLPAKERKKVTTASDDIGVMDLIKEFMRMRE